MGRQSDSFERAAACDRVMKLETNEVRRKVFSLFREMWITLANESPSLGDETLAKEVAAIEQIQANFHSGKDGTHSSEL